MGMAPSLSAVEANQRIHGQVHSSDSLANQFRRSSHTTGGSKQHKEGTNHSVIGTLEEASFGQ